jgi:LysR family transcriptional regulator, regulator of abg operon
MNRLSRSVPTLLSLIRVIEHGSINKAAEVLNISQPALTRSITRLEEVLGVPILDRSARGVSTTIFGDALLFHAQALEAELGNTLRDIAALKNNKTGSFRIGATPLVASHFLARGLQAVFARQEKVPVRLAEGNRPQLLGQLRRGELDLVVSTFPFESNEPDLVQKPLFELDLRVIVRAEHALTRRDPLMLRDMADHRWILPRADSGLYRRVERDFRRAGVEFPGSVIETSSLEATRSLVLSTDLIAIMPLRAVAAQIAAGQLVALSGDWSFEHRTVGIFLRQDSDLRDIGRVFCEALSRPAD